MENFQKEANKEKVTIYYDGMFGVVSVEAKLVKFGLKKYAQYQSVPFVYYIPKGKRKVIGIQKTFQAFILVVKGWDLKPLTGDEFDFEISKSNGMTVKKSKHLSFASSYTEEFNERFNNVDSEIIFDARYNVETSLNSEVSSDSVKEDIYEVYASFDSKYKGKSKSRADETYDRFKSISINTGSTYTGKEITMMKNSEIINTFK